MVLKSLLAQIWFEYVNYCFLCLFVGVMPGGEGGQGAQMEINVG